MSKTFKTPKGTELPVLDLRGKDYLQVAHRLVWFREEKPDWTIETEIVRASEKECLFRAFIKDAGGRIIATAHKQEDAQGFRDFLEKAETGAVGRALAMCGYGTQFAPEILEDSDVVDAPSPPKSPPAAPPQSVGQKPSSLVTSAQIKRMFAIAKVHGWDETRIRQFMKVRFQLESTKELNRFNYDLLVSTIEKSQKVENPKQ